MKHKQIPGWFNFEDIYLKMIRLFNEGHFVEIGTFMGKSAHFMAVEIYNSGKEIQFDTIDTFLGSPNEMQSKHKVFNEMDVYQRAKDNLKGLPVNIIKSDSIEASKNYKDGSLDFVFIDGSHTYEDVCKDIRAWFPKVKNGGFIGGHDYDNKNVNKAVKDTLRNDCPYSKTSWLIGI